MFFQRDGTGHMQHIVYDMLHMICRVPHHIWILALFMAGLKNADAVLHRVPFSGLIVMSNRPNPSC